MKLSEGEYTSEQEALYSQRRTGTGDYHEVRQIREYKGAMSVLQVSGRAENLLYRASTRTRRASGFLDAAGKKSVLPPFLRG